MQIIVTGASGFVGSSVVAKLRNAGHLVTPVSRKQSYSGTYVRSYQDTPVGDVLIHLAEESNRVLSDVDGQVAIDRSLETLEALIAKNYRHIIYASSALVYGTASSVPHQTDSEVHASDTYTKIKILSEKAILNCDGTVARLTNVYGPGMNSSTVLPELLEQLKEVGPIKLRQILPVRDFVWHDDVASAFLCMVTAQKSGLYNVGSGTGTSIKKLAEIALGIAGQTDRQIIASSNSTTQSNLLVDCQSTQEDFGWRPQKSLPDGLRQMMHVA